jgi:protoheme IX farnesyltransferase
MSALGKLKDYYALTKPGIIRGNLFTAAAGFLLASAGQIDFLLMAATLGGLALVIASGCVFNNMLDRRIDSKMARTRNRALVRGRVSLESAKKYGVVLAIAGFGTLLVLTTWLAAVAAAVGFIFYVVVYGYAKRHSVYGTLVGSVSGAIPPVVGYTAVSGTLDSGAVLLFAILTLWQMPHFYSIAMFRYDDYKTAKLPVLPVVRGMDKTKRQILFYIFFFTIAMPLLSFYGHTGLTYAAASVLLGIYWLRTGLVKYEDKDVTWAKRMFGLSLFVLTAWCVLIALNPILP